MREFTTLELYGIDRETFLKMTGTDPKTEIIRLTKDVHVLRENHSLLIKQFRSNPNHVNQLDRERRLIDAIAVRIERKQRKILDYEEIDKGVDNE